MAVCLSVCLYCDSIDGLLLDPDHHRASLPDANKQWLQSMHTECLAQLAAHGQGREALLADPAAREALEAVAHSGLNETAREMASSALVALSDRQPEPISDDGSDGGQKHVMLSYQWNDQAVIVNRNLIALASWRFTCEVERAVAASRVPHVDRA